MAKLSTETIRATNSISVARGYVEDLNEELVTLRTQMDQTQDRAQNEDDVEKLRELELRSTNLEVDSKENRELLSVAKVHLQSLEDRKANFNNNINQTSERGSVNDSVYDTPEYRNAWMESVVKGSNKIVERYLGTNTGNGEVLIPTQILAGIEDKFMNMNNSLLPYVTQMAINAQVEIPFVASKGPNDETTIQGAAFHTEGAAAIAEEVNTFDSITLSPKTMKKWLRVSTEWDTMAPAEWQAWIIDEMASAISELLTYSIIQGSLDVKNKGVEGILSESNGLVKTFNIGDNVSWSTGYAARGELSTRVNNVMAVMNSKTFYQNYMTQENSQKDAVEAVFKQVVGPDGTVRQYYCGAQVVFNDYLPAFDDAADGDTTIVMGDFKGFAINKPTNKLMFIKDIYSEAELDMIKYITYIMAAGAVIKDGFFVKLNKGSL